MMINMSVRTSPKVLLVVISILVALIAVGCGPPDIEKLRENQDFDEIIRILEDEDQDISLRVAAAHALEGNGDQESVRALIETYNESRTLYRGRRLREACLDSLVHIGTRDAAAGLLEVVWEVPFGDRENVEMAMEGLVEIGDEAVREIEDAYTPRLEDGPESSFERIVRLLDRIGGEDAFRILAQLAGTIDGTSSCMVCDGTPASFDARHDMVLLSMVEDGEISTEYLLSLMESEDPIMREVGAYALRAASGEQVEDSLVEACSDEQVWVPAFVSLAKVNAERAGEFIANFINEKDPGEREWAIYAIRDSELPASEIKDGDYEQIVRYLLDVLGSDDSVVSSQAYYVLSGFGDERAVEPLIDALQHEKPYVRQNAAQLLGKIGDDRALEPLIQATQDEDSDVREKANQALARVANSEELLPYLEQEQTYLVYKALIQIGDEETQEELIDALWQFGDENMAVTYLNCGNPDLEEAAREWARDHGYLVTSLPAPGSSGGTVWGGQ